MTFTTPALIAPVTLTGAAEQLTVNYSAGSPDDVQLDAGTYYATGDNTLGDDLWTEIGAKLTADADGNWSAKYATSGAWGIFQLTKTGGTKTVTGVTFNLAELTAHALGLTTTTGAGVTIPMAGGSLILATYRPRWALSLDELDFGLGRLSNRRVAATATDDGGGSAATYAAAAPIDIDQIVVKAAHVYATHADDADFADQIELAIADPNACLERWLDHLTADNFPGDFPVLRLLPDRDTPGTSHDVRIVKPEMYASPVGWVGEEPARERPLYWRARYRLLEVPT
jgi:hypothetical protein